MPEHFDPYHKWLGIPPKDQPPNHYRLLGIEVFESDREVIDAAANRLMAYLQDLSTGENAASAQRLLNQISAARLELLTPDRKVAYDHQLRVDSAPVARPVVRPAPPMARPATAVPTPPQTPVGTPAQSPVGTPAPPASAPTNAPTPIVIADDDRRGGRITGKRPASGSSVQPRKKPSVAPIVVLAVLAVVAAGAAVYVLTRPSPPAPEQKPAEIVVIEQQPSGSKNVILTGLRIDIPESDRRALAISIDRKKRSVPKTGEIILDLQPGTHAIVIRRLGYITISRDITITDGRILVMQQPKWKIDENAQNANTEFDIPEGAMDDLRDVQPKTEDATDERPQDGDGEKADRPGS